MGYLVLEEYGDWWAYVRAATISELSETLTERYPGEFEGESGVIILQTELENQDKYEISLHSRYKLEKVVDNGGS